jgi:hypothetical protein
MTSDYFKDLKRATKELAGLLANREQIEIEIARQKRKVAALSELCNEDEIVDLVPSLELGGLTEACTTALRGTRKEWLTTTEILAALKELGFQLGHYKAPIASITTTVNRLVEDGVVVADKRLGAGATEYKWVGRVVPTILPYTAVGQALIRQRMGEGKPFTTEELKELTESKKK